ncbi:ABC transporter substrate-binding protein [Providencia rettgeri]|uniref:ABC transporter substrate-binding protein n=1 Tax=Alcaligenes parafaecalis TaxID=171260 RepID=A0ABT3VU57_9BURK|nr:MULTISPECIES: ABC transporter substrate-binding protein [Alcaligenes]MBY6344552.1 ABC transporter substrate-binding protein [Providencia rettgeri]MCX5465760.1 ABC transporter substrate-binding protein [Alcaligenes parafaecalis]QTC01329.1 ABC transporter substrate-binding protein [Alcaligenes sp. SORT26]
MNCITTGRLTTLAAALALSLPVAVSAQIKVGVTVAATGPAASLGIPERNTVSLLPTEVAGQKIEYIVLDDATDTTVAVRNMRKLITDDKVDVVIGTSVTPGSLAMVDVAGETKTPMISVAANAKIVDPVEGARTWVFKTPQNDQLMAGALAEAMVKQNVKTLGFIGYNDAYGDGWLNVITEAAQAKGIKVLGAERYGRNDTSVTGQVLKLLGTKPDAVLIAGSGTPVALPQRELKGRGYAGIIYQTHGAANSDVLRVCGKDCNDMILPAGPLLVAEQLPDSSSVKKTAMDYKEKYEAKYGAGSINTFGGHMWDAGLLVTEAIPVALKSGAKPGTPEFRAALRDALEQTKELAASQGVFNMSPTDHAGLDTRAHVIVKVVDGKWTYQPDL